MHEGHLGIIAALCDLPEIDRVLVVPTRRSPFKDAAPLLPPEVRWGMLRQALLGLPTVMLWDVELRRAPPSYSFETLQRLASLAPGARLQLAMGWDVFEEFAQWHQARYILEMAGLLVFDRSATAPPISERWRDWAALLPPPFDSISAPGGENELVTPAGRRLLRCVPLELPDLSSRRILREQTLEGVPPGAREVLAAYWGQSAGR